MKTFAVELPIVGWLYTEVEAEDEDEAIQKALASDVRSDDIQEWEAVRRVSEGNICHAPRNSAEAYIVDSGE